MSEQLHWRTSSFSDGMQCVQVADLGEDTIGLRDSKDPNGLVLRFPREEVSAFVKGAKAGEFDDLG